MIDRKPIQISNEIHRHANDGDEQERRIFVTHIGHDEIEQKPCTNSAERIHHALKDDFCAIA